MQTLFGLVHLSINKNFENILMQTDSARTAHLSTQNK